MKGKQLFLSLLVLMLILAACGDAARDAEPPVPDLPTTGADADRPVNSNNEATAIPDDGPSGDSSGQGTDSVEGGIIEGEATVESLQIMIMESFPVQVNVRVNGYLGDGCTEVGEISSEREEDTFIIRIISVRPADAICTQQLVGLEETIALDVHGLEAGTYTVDVNGVTDTFTLDIDNILPED
jgi:inhibitor of cysteine peptidase